MRAKDQPFNDAETIGSEKSLFEMNMARRHEEEKRIQESLAAGINPFTGEKMISEPGWLEP